MRWKRQHRWAVTLSEENTGEANPMLANGREHVTIAGQEFELGAVYVCSGT